MLERRELILFASPQHTVSHANLLLHKSPTTSCIACSRGVSSFFSSTRISYYIYTHTQLNHYTHTHTHTHTHIHTHTHTHTHAHSLARTHTQTNTHTAMRTQATCGRVFDSKYGTKYGEWDSIHTRTSRETYCWWLTAGATWCACLNATIGPRQTTRHVVARPTRLALFVSNLWEYPWEGTGWGMGDCASPSLSPPVMMVSEGGRG